MKRFLLSVLAAACVLGTVSGAFGASYSDVAGTKYESAVGLLSELGILTGYADGTFRPGNTITRAEFAAVAVRTLGLGTAAEMSKGATTFSDVPATHWASGFINVASDQRLITGYPDGTFKPEAPVTYAEALAIVIRMLGYAPVVTGSWPTGYIVKAYELGLPEGVSFAAGAPATRGDVALFVENSLTVNLLKQVYSGALVSYAVSDETILEDRLGYESVTGRVTDVPRLFESDVDEGEVAIGTHVYDIAEGTRFSDDWLGQEVRVWLTEDDEIVVVLTVTPADHLVAGTIKDIWPTRVKIDKKTYGFADDPWTWSQNLVHGTVDNDDPSFMNYEGRAVLDGDGDVAALYAWLFKDSLFLTKVTPSQDRVQGIDEDADTWKKDLVDGYDDYVLLKEGQPAELDDLAAGDVAHIYEPDADGDYLWMEVYAERVEGEVESIDTTTDEDIVLTVDGEEYTLAEAVTYSIDENETFVELVDETDLEPFAGEDATLYLNRDGEVRHVAGKVGAATVAKNVGVLKTEFYKMTPSDPTEPDQYFIKLLRADGATVKLELTEDTKIDGVLVDLDEIDTGGGDDYDEDYPSRTLFEYTLDKSGDLATLGSIEPDEDCAFDPDDEACLDPDRKICCERRVLATTVFFDIDLSKPLTGTADWKVRPWSEFKTIQTDSEPIEAWAYEASATTLAYFVYDHDGEDITYATSPATAGVVTSRQVLADGTKIKVYALDSHGDPVQVSYFVTEDTDIETLGADNHGDETSKVTDLDVGDYVLFTLTGTDFATIEEPEAESPFDVPAYEAYVKEFDEEALVIEVQDDPEDPDESDEFILDTDCVVWDVTGLPVPADLEDLNDDLLVQVLDVNGDDLVEVVKILE